MPIQYHHYLIGITLVLSLFSFKYIIKQNVKILLLLLLSLNLGFEFAASIKWYIYKTSNIPIYNFVLGYTFIMWLLLLFYIDKSIKRRFIIYAILLFLIFYLTDILFLQGGYRFNTYSFLIGTIMSTFFTYRILYFDILDKKGMRLSQFEIIILCAGLIYHIGFSVMFFTNEWGATTLEVFKDLTLYQLVAYLINTCFYGLLSLAFLRAIKQFKKK